MADTSHDEPDADPAGDAALERAALAGSKPVPSGPAAGAPTPKGPARLGGFLRSSWAELQRVQWPDRSQVGQATAVVIGFVVIAGAYLGLADAVAKQIVDFIL